MTLQAAGLCLIAIVVGALISLQAPINAGAAARLGHPLYGAALSFVIGTFAVVGVAIAVAGWPHDLAARLSGLPVLYLLAGGLLGAAFVSASIYLAPEIGITAFISFAIAGQLGMGLLLDYVGAFGLIARELTAGRLLGAGMVLTGAVLVARL